MKTRNLRRLGALSLLCAATVPAVGLAAEGKACSALSTFKLAGHNVEITSAVEVPAGPMAARPGGPPAPPVIVVVPMVVEPPPKWFSNRSLPLPPVTLWLLVP